MNFAKQYESILNNRKYDEVSTVSIGDSNTEGANEIISFTFDWPVSLKTIQRDCPQMSIENFQTSKHYAFEIKAKGMLCMNPEARKLFPFL